MLILLETFLLGLGVPCPSLGSLVILGVGCLSSHRALSHCFNKWRHSGGGSNKTHGQNLARQKHIHASALASVYTEYRAHFTSKFGPFHRCSPACLWGHGLPSLNLHIISTFQEYLKTFSPFDDTNSYFPMLCGLIIIFKNTFTVII